MPSTATKRATKATAAPSKAPAGDVVDMDERDRDEAEAGSRGLSEFDAHDPDEDEGDDEGGDDEGDDDEGGDDEPDELEAARAAAIEAGMTAGEAADFESAKQLHKATAALRRQADSLRAAAETARAGSVSGPTGADAGRAGDPGDDGLQAEIDAIVEDEEVSPKMAKLLKKLALSHSALRAKVTAPPREVPVHSMDFAIGGLSKGFAELFGEGPGESLPKASVHRANRVKVIEAMERHVEQERQAGRPIPSPRKAFDKALQDTFGESVRTIESKDRGDAAARRGRSFLQRPAGSTQGNLPRGDKRAIAGIRAWAAEKGHKLKDDGAGIDD